jgi:dephospho-CoA kinase
MLSIGIGGNIGSGKTTAAKELVRLYQKDKIKVKLIDADSLAWEIYKRVHNKGQRVNVYDKIVKTFGTEILNHNKEIDRKKLGMVVFDNKQSLQNLNKIVHPALIKHINNEIKKADAEVKILDAALLFFWGKKIPLTYRVLVSSSDTNKIKRMAIRGYKSAEVKMRLKNQLKESAMDARADFVVENNGTLKNLKNRIYLLYKIITEN